MKKTLIAIVALAAASSAIADTHHPLATPDEFLEVSANTYEWGVTAHRESYREFDSKGKLMQEIAQMTGIKGSLTRTLGDTGGQVVLTGEYAAGRADYTGSYIGGQYGDLAITGLRRSLFEATGTYKQTSPMWRGVTAGVGLGYRQLVDNLQDAGPGGYKRTNDRVYLSLGVERTIELNRWTVTPGVQYKHLLASRQTSDLQGGVTVNQHDGYGAEASVAVHYKGDGYKSVITPFVRIWDIQDSAIDGRTGLYEPRNKTKEVGLSVAVQF